MRKLLTFIKLKLQGYSNAEIWFMNLVKQRRSDVKPSEPDMDAIWQKIEKRIKEESPELFPHTE